MKQWQTKEELVELLCSLVEYPSITGSEAEIALVEYLYHQLSERTYFQSNPEHLKLHPLKDGRRLLTGLVKKGNTSDTIILLSHFDVVGVEDFGSKKNLSFHPKALTADYHRYRDELPDSVQNDLERGEWLFGRGVMDMKAGLTLHMSMLEKAMDGEFEGNILLLTVPDEEANSLGMLSALPALQQIKEQENLTFRACLNGEPMFSQYPGDPHNYVYSGSIGKVLPGFFCYGKETHVGEPFAGLNANLMVSYLAQELELNEAFIETVGDETTPPPVSLMQRDLKEEYSVQTPQTAVAMYNVLYLKQSVKELNEKLLQAAYKASEHTTAHYNSKARAFHKEKAGLEFPEMNVRVLMYEELVEEAVSRFGRREVERRENLLMNQREKGDREFSTLLVHELASLCKDLAPMIVLFYSPPFYPAVSSKQDPYIEETLKNVMHFTKKHYKVELEEIEFFPGLSDLSFIGPTTSQTTLGTLMDNMPLKGKGYDLTEGMLQTLQMPILNVGPRGKDPHQWTERLELSYSFEYLPHILTDTIHHLLKK
ncbi:M20/M25/M40 family metallo-hydrolase [Pontibacillus yanchengensis]|uniref:M20/M25/M40 family metallo-hydrolase n=2 Tax=Pontibacillus yanchengensis TaxID=462910 RepID=A0ACC7VK22_9BACI|nr:M20/M25/M40 family metallo-hydrolase [Pontibacillus yanchengensis]MYL32648.1 M20/M25/M40 family metallo-hydrolase [Pontibacillus yanchengensis]MYL55042.1 M20/M25/M40 family metallo-hydrolase [Pontibacillus yanchengensis]